MSQLMDLWEDASVRIKQALLETVVSVRHENVIMDIRKILALFLQTLAVS